MTNLRPSVARVIRLVPAIVAAFLATAASAERPSTLDMTCAEAAALVTARGAVVLGTGGYTYKRFVAHAGFCIHGEETVAGWAPTREGRCRIGSICRPPLNFPRMR